mmetsp:Transcript_19352/g.30740  ORF Transcript_19352/g.30740 Transcript_19352/m.30740 type:complete len:84 (-) Transcript_19352:372-623(-)
MAEEQKLDAYFILVCIEADMKAAVKFHAHMGLGDKVIHLQGRSRSLSRYGLKYIPHKCVVDKKGVVVLNYNGDAEAMLAKACE